MRFGAAFVNTGKAIYAEGAVAVAQAAEAAGYDSLWTVEHVVVPAGYESQYPYSPTGKMPGTEESPIPDPLIWLTYVAAATTTIKLGTGILILPQRNPVILAKETATLDLMSNGRVLLGIGIGWLAEEFTAIGIPFADRGNRTDEYVAALRTLWRDPSPSIDGKFVSFHDAKMYPKPVQPGGIPIVVGGHTEAAARRAGRLGDGFFPVFTTPEQLAPILDVMRSAARDAGRDENAIEITVGGGIDTETIRQFEDLGVSRVVAFGAGRDIDHAIGNLRGFADNVMAKFT
jgi:probable F420-dependent oxidoreductase